MKRALRLGPQLKARTHYKLRAQDILNQTRASLVSAIEIKNTGAGNIQKMFKGGQYISKEMIKGIDEDCLRAPRNHYQGIA